MSKPPEERLSVRRAVTLARPVIEMVEDFVDYLDHPKIKRSTLVNRYIAEQKDIFNDINGDMASLAELYVPQKRVFPSYLDIPGGGEPILYGITAPNAEHYAFHAERLLVSIGWMARTAILHGLALNMEAESFVPEPLGRGLTVTNQPQISTLDS